MEESNNKNVSTFTGHSSPHPSNSCLICLYYLLNTMFLNFLLSLTYLTLRLLFSLLTFSSESLFKCAEKLSHYLISLSNELDQTFWPYMIIRFPYMILNKLHFLLATYFEEQLVSHFYEVNICTYAKTALYIGPTNKTCFNYCSICQDLAEKVFKVLVCYSKSILIEHDYKRCLQKLCIKLSRLVLPGKLISDVPNEAKAVECTDKVANYCSDPSSQCNTTRVEPKFNLLSTHHPEFIHDDVEATSFETDKLSDTMQPLYYKYCTTFDRGKPLSKEKAKQELVIPKVSYDTNTNSKYPLNSTLYQSQYLSSKVATPLHNNTSLELYEKCQKNKLQLSQLAVNTQNVTETVAKYHCFRLVVILL